MFQTSIQCLVARYYRNFLLIIGHPLSARVLCQWAKNVDWLIFKNWMSRCLMARDLLLDKKRGKKAGMFLKRDLGPILRTPVTTPRDFLPTNLKKRSSLLQRWCCRCKLRRRRIGSRVDPIKNTRLINIENHFTSFLATAWRPFFICCNHEIENAHDAVHSGHRVRLQNIRSRVRNCQGVLF
jgi:hypothetical protein